MTTPTTYETQLAAARQAQQQATAKLELFADEVSAQAVAALVEVLLNVDDPVLRYKASRLVIDEVKTGIRHAAHSAVQQMRAQGMPAMQVGAELGISHQSVSRLSHDAPDITTRRAERVEIDGRLVHPDAPHGTSPGYSAWACRCRPCTAAHTKANMASRERRKEQATNT